VSVDNSSESGNNGRRRRHARRAGPRCNAPQPLLTVEPDGIQPFREAIASRIREYYVFLYRFQTGNHSYGIEA